MAAVAALFLAPAAHCENVEAASGVASKRLVPGDRTLATVTARGHPLHFASHSNAEVAAGTSGTAC